MNEMDEPACMSYFIFFFIFIMNYDLLFYILSLLNFQTYPLIANHTYSLESSKGKAVMVEESSVDVVDES